MSAREVYRAGVLSPGWRCAKCGDAFRHDGRPARTYLRLVTHKVKRRRSHGPIIPRRIVQQPQVKWLYNGPNSVIVTWTFPS